MPKDPAALLYIDTWKVATTEMSAIERAYYMDLILHQYDKGSLPNDIEELANICRVRYSEFKQFEQVFEQVLKHKFKHNENGRLENEFASEIIRRRQSFIDKRSESGKISYMVRFAKQHLKAKKAEIEYLKNNVDLDSVDMKNEQVFKQMLKQKIELYINGDENEIEIKTVVYPFDSENFTEYWDYWKEYKKKEYKFTYKSAISEQGALKELSRLAGGSESKALKIIEQSISNGWKGFFELKKEHDGSKGQLDDYKRELIERANK
jgi:uncharacterized protein YdaU (DUF1376 family)